METNQRKSMADLAEKREYIRRKILMLKMNINLYIVGSTPELELKDMVILETIQKCIEVAGLQAEERGRHTKRGYRVECVYNKKKNTCGITYDSRRWAEHNLHNIEQFIDEVTDVFECDWQPASKKSDVPEKNVRHGLAKGIACLIPNSGRFYL